MQSATYRRAITLLEVLVTIVVILILVIAIVIPMLAKQRKDNLKARNSVKLRAIHHAMVTFSQGNKFWLPGSTTSGKVDANAAISNRHGSIMRLQSADYFEADINISPAEHDKTVSSHGLSATSPNQRGSFAVLEYATDGEGSNLAKLGYLEWRDQLNTSAILMSDRQLGKPGEKRSLWTRDSWTGHVLFADNHVEFLFSDGPVPSKYGPGKSHPPSHIGLLFDCCQNKGARGDGRMVAD